MASGREKKGDYKKSIRKAWQYGREETCRLVQRLELNMIRPEKVDSTVRNRGEDKKNINENDWNITISATGKRGTPWGMTNSNGWGK